MLKQVLFTIAINKFESIAKTKSYAAENEVRLLYKPKDSKFLINFYDEEYRRTSKVLFYNMYNHIRETFEKLHLNKSYYECIGGRIRKVCKMSLTPLMMYNPIKEIILGPNCTQGKKELIEFARQNGFMISSKNVKKSHIKPRNTK